MPKMKKKRVSHTQGALPSMVEQQKLERQSVRYVVCEVGNVHIIASCPRCRSAEGGLLIGTVSGIFGGVTGAKCADCGNEVGYYVDVTERRVWSMEDVEVKRTRVTD